MKEQKMLCEFHIAKEQSTNPYEMFKEALSAGWEVKEFEVVRGCSGGLYVTALLERILFKV